MNIFRKTFLAILFFFVFESVFFENFVFAKDVFTGGSFEALDMAPYPAKEAYLTGWGLFSKFKSIEELIQAIIYFLSYIVGALALLGFFVGGGMMIFGGAMEGMIEKGKTVIVYSIIGLSVAILSYAITTFVTTVLYSIE